MDFAVGNSQTLTLVERLIVVHLAFSEDSVLEHSVVHIVSEEQQLIDVVVLVINVVVHTLDTPQGCVGQTLVLVRRSHTAL